jgi:hypothetical protein
MLLQYRCRRMATTLRRRNHTPFCTWSHIRPLHQQGAAASGKQRPVGVDAAAAGPHLAVEL